MKEKFLKRIGCLLVVVTMVFGTAVSAFAAETNEVDKQNDEKTVVADYTLQADNEGNVISVRSNNVVGSVIQSGQSATYYPNLDSYIGINKSFVAMTSCNNNSGAVYLYLYKNDTGKLVSNDWIMGVNDQATWTVTLPSSGTYRLRVVLSGTTDWVSFSARWA